MDLIKLQMRRGDYKIQTVEIHLCEFGHLDHDMVQHIITFVADTMRLTSLLIIIKPILTRMQKTM
jgi:hypothetical protein